MAVVWTRLTRAKNLEISESVCAPTKWASWLGSLATDDAQRRVDICSRRFGCRLEASWQSREAMELGSVILDRRLRPLLAATCCDVPSKLLDLNRDSRNRWAWPSCRFQSVPPPWMAWPQVWRPPRNGGSTWLLILGARADRSPAMAVPGTCQQAHCDHISCRFERCRHGKFLTPPSQDPKTMHHTDILGDRLCLHTFHHCVWQDSYHFWLRFSARQAGRQWRSMTNNKLSTRVACPQLVKGYQGNYKQWWIQNLLHIPVDVCRDLWKLAMARCSLTIIFAAGPSQWVSLSGLQSEQRHKIYT